MLIIKRANITQPDANTTYVDNSGNFDYKKYVVEHNIGDSMLSVARQVETKRKNKTISNITTKTAAKIAVSKSVQGALLEGTIAAPVVNGFIKRVIPEKKNTDVGIH